jgi:drug/metabolite transporter (DMT)-like permease
MSWIWYAILNALALSAVHFTQKRALREEHSLEFVTVTTVVRLIIFYLLFWTRINWTISNGQLLGLIATAIFAGIAFWMISKALRRQDISIVVPIINLDAGVTAIIAWIALGETLAAKQILGLAVLLIGTYVLHISGAPHVPGARRDLLFPFRELWRHASGRYAFVAVIAFAINAILDRSLLQHVPWETYLAYVLPITMAFFLLLSAARGHTFSTYRHSWKNILPWVFLASVFYLISNITSSIAIGLAPIGLVIAIKRGATLIDVLVSGKIFHEQAIIPKAIAASVMLVGLFLILT